MLKDCVRYCAKRLCWLLLKITIGVLVLSAISFVIAHAEPGIESSSEINFDTDVESSSEINYDTEIESSSEINFDIEMEDMESVYVINDVQALADAIVLAMDTVDNDVIWDTVVLQLCRDIVQGIDIFSDYLAYRTGNDYKLIIGDIVYDNGLFTYTDCTIVTLHRYTERESSYVTNYFYDMSYSSGSGSVHWVDAYIYSSLGYFPRLISQPDSTVFLSICSIFALIVLTVFLIIGLFWDFVFRGGRYHVKKNKYISN